MEAQLDIWLREGMTISGWAQPTSTSEERTAIFSIEDSCLPSSVLAVWVRRPGNTLYFSYLRDEDDLVVTDTGISHPIGKFHFAITYDSAGFSLYINGKKQKSFSETKPIRVPQNVRQLF